MHHHHHQHQFLIVLLSLLSIDLLTVSVTANHTDTDTRTNNTIITKTVTYSFSNNANLGIPGDYLLNQNQRYYSLLAGWNNRGYLPSIIIPPDYLVNQPIKFSISITNINLPPNSLTDFCFKFYQSLTSNSIISNSNSNNPAAGNCYGKYSNSPIKLADEYHSGIIEGTVNESNTAIDLILSIINIRQYNIYHPTIILTMEYIVNPNYSPIPQQSGYNLLALILGTLLAVILMILLLAVVRVKLCLMWKRKINQTNPAITATAAVSISTAAADTVINIDTNNTAAVNPVSVELIVATIQRDQLMDEFHRNRRRRAHRQRIIAAELDNRINGSELYKKDHNTIELFNPKDRRFSTTTANNNEHQQGGNIYSYQSQSQYNNTINDNNTIVESELINIQIESAEQPDPDIQFHLQQLYLDSIQLQSQSQQQQQQQQEQLSESIIIPIKLDKSINESVIIDNSNSNINHYQSNIKPQSNNNNISTKPLSINSVIIDLDSERIRDSN